jgi:hypothetical protein
MQAMIDTLSLPDADPKRAPGQRTDLRRLSAWIKMIRALEEAKQHKSDGRELIDVRNLPRVG